MARARAKAGRVYCGLTRHEASHMSVQKSLRLRVYLTGMVMLAELAHLAWEFFNGGVRSHHLLARADLPEVSNWWGLVLLPALTWFLVGRIRRRIAALPGNKNPRTTTHIVAAFCAALMFGVLLSIAFTTGQATLSSYLFFGVLLAATFLPVYRAECLLGFVLGMTFTFGAVLPVLIGSLIAALSAFFHVCVHPVLVWIASAFKRKRAMVPERARGMGD